MACASSLSAGRTGDLCEAFARTKARDLDPEVKRMKGRAGTGKSYTLQAVREAHAGCRVIGLAPTNTVAQDLMRDGFAEAATVHGALFALKKGCERWDHYTVVIVDESAMLSTRVMGALMAEAECAGAKMILAGNDR